LSAGHRVQLTAIRQQLGASLASPTAAPATADPLMPTAALPVSLSEVSHAETLPRDPSSPPNTPNDQPTPNTEAPSPDPQRADRSPESGLRCPVCGRLMLSRPLPRPKPSPSGSGPPGPGRDPPQAT
jgi:hypothetical protein